MFSVLSQKIRPTGRLFSALRFETCAFNLLTPLCFDQFPGHLSGPGPFTVFAPTNDAFAKIDAATLESLAKPENKDQLTAILTRVGRVEDSNSCRSP